MNASLGLWKGGGMVRAGGAWIPVLAALGIACCPVQAQYFDYLVTGGKATLTRYHTDQYGANLPGSVGPAPTYPYPLVAIGPDAFRDCNRVTWLGLPRSMTSIHASAFDDCPNLEHLSVDAANPVYSVSGWVLYNKAKTGLIRCPEGFAGECVIPATVRAIGAGAFQNCRRLGWAGMPAGVRTIGDYAFRGCDNLQYLRLPASFVALGSGAFADCTELKGLLFEGNAPGYLHPGGELGMFNSDSQTTVFVPQGSTGWDPTFCGRPIVRYPALDAYEADDTAGTARTIANGRTQTRTLHETFDVDWVQFTVDGAGAQDPQFLFTGDVGAPGGQLFGPDDPNLYLAASTTWNFGVIARIRLDSLAPGTYWLRIANGGTSPIPRYRLQANWNSPGGDNYESDDLAAAAKPIFNGATQERNIHAAGNEDWAVFRVGGRGAQNVVVATAGASGDTQLWLYNGSGAQIAYDDNSGTGRFSRITVAALAPGTYSIKVREYNNDGTIDAYSLRVAWTEVPAAGDAYEPDNTMAAAHAIANGRSQNRSIHVPGDTDWVKFTVGGAGARKVQVETGGAGGDTQLWLYRANGTEAARDDDSGPGHFSRIELAALAPGTYYLKVREHGHNGTIPRYTLRVVWTAASVPVDAYEPDGGQANAKTIRNGRTQRRSIHAAGNEDWVKFTVGNGWGNAYNLRLETSGTKGDTQMWLYGPNSATMRVAYDDNSGTGKLSRITVGALAWGTYYVRIREKGNDGRIAAYQLRASWTER